MATSKLAQALAARHSRNRWRAGKKPRNGCPIRRKPAQAREPTHAGEGDGPIKARRQLEIPDGHAPGASEPSRGGLNL